MVYTTHLWWLGGWFIIAIPTLFIFKRRKETKWIQHEGYHGHHGSLQDLYLSHPVHRSSSFQVVWAEWDWPSGIHQTEPWQHLFCFELPAVQSALCAAKEGLRKPRSSARLRTNTLENHGIHGHLCAVKICQEDLLLSKRWDSLFYHDLLLYSIEVCHFFLHFLESSLVISDRRSTLELPGSGPTGAMGQALGVWHCRNIKGPRKTMEFPRDLNASEETSCIWQILAVLLVLPAWEAESNQVL